MRPFGGDFANEGGSTEGAGGEEAAPNEARRIISMKHESKSWLVVRSQSLHTLLSQGSLTCR